MTVTNINLVYTSVLWRDIFGGNQISAVHGYSTGFNFVHEETTVDLFSSKKVSFADLAINQNTRSSRRSAAHEPCV